MTYLPGPVSDPHAPGVTGVRVLEHACTAAAGQATDYVKSLETADGETMPRLKCGQFGIGGFPFGFDVTCTDATIESGDVTVTVAGRISGRVTCQKTSTSLAPSMRAASK